MNPNQPPSSREPKPTEPEDPAKEVAKGAAMGCLAGFGAIGGVLVIGVLAMGAVVLVGVFLVFLSCSGH